MTFNFGSFMLGFFVAFVLSTALTIVEAVVKNLRNRKADGKERKDDGK